MPLTSDQTILNGKYRILGLIGQGAFARVWLAEELTFGNRRVALKEPRSDLLPEDAADVQRRFQQEIRLTAQMMDAQVPNIVPSWTVESWEGAHLLVMRYMAGGSLESLLAQHLQGLPVGQAVQITCDLLQALEAFHHLTTVPVHRDVKPSNVLFDDEGQVYLADFGLTQLPGISGRSRMLAGAHPATPLYAAPEQLKSPEPLMPAADLYALGCVLFEMLTGKRYKRVRPGTAASTLRGEVPGWLDAVLAKTLAKDPWDRWEGAAEMGKALETGLSEAERARQEAAEQALREAERLRLLADWRAEAERLVDDDPERALQWVKQIQHEAPDYEGLDDLERRAEGVILAREQEAKRRQRLADWYAEAERLVGHQPERALEWVRQIRYEEPGYEGLADLERRAKDALDTKAREEQRRHRLAALHTEAERLVERDPERALALLKQIRCQEPGYEDLAALERRAHDILGALRREEQRRKQLAALYAEAERLVSSNPSHALALASQIRHQEENYGGLAAVERKAQAAIDAARRQARKWARWERRWETRRGFKRKVTSAWSRFSRWWHHEWIWHRERPIAVMAVLLLLVLWALGVLGPLLRGTWAWVSDVGRGIWAWIRGLRPALSSWWAGNLALRITVGIVGGVLYGGVTAVSGSLAKDESSCLAGIVCALLTIGLIYFSIRLVQHPGPGEYLSSGQLPFFIFICISWVLVGGMILVLAS